LVSNENILLQTLGFDVAIDHPHTHVVKCCQLVKASKELAQTSYFMATNSLHLTTMCLRYPPTIVACVCIHLACKWSKYEIPLSVSGKPWYSYVDPTSNIEQIERLTKEFLTIFDKCPSRLKKKILQSHNDTKEEEDRRARDNTQPNQYRPDFGEGKPPGAPGQPVSSRPSSSSGQPGKPHPSGRPPSQPPTSGHKYPPGHPSASKPPPPGHSKPPGHPSAPPQGQHPSKQVPPPGHHSSKNPPPPGYRPGQPKHGEKPQVPPPGHRPGTHSRSQSQGGQPLSEEQLRAVKEQQHRERREHSQGRDHSRTDMKQPSVPGMPVQGAPNSGGYPPGYRTSSSQPPPYPGQPHSQPGREQKPSSQSKPPSHQPKPSMSRSIFDLSPEKSSRSDKPPPPIAPLSEPVQNPNNYHDTLPPYPGHAPPPTYQDPNTSLPNYPKPPVAAPFQPPLSLSPIRDTPSLNLARQPSLEPGEIMDTPTPTHISNMFSYPPNPGYSSKPTVPPPKAKDDNRSLQSILGFCSTGGSKLSELAPPPSKLQQDLFGSDFDLPDQGASLPLLPLPPVPSLPAIPVKTETDNFKPKAEPSVSDFSDLFGDDSNSSNFMPSFSQSRPSFSNTFKPGPVKTEPQAPQVKAEPRVKYEPQQQPHSKLPSSPLKPPKREKDSLESKRKSSTGSGSDEKKPRVSSRSGGLFSPSPERKSSVPPSLKSPLLSPLTSPTGHGKRTRTASTSSNGEAMVNVQKLEHIAPEFQAFKGTHGPASILVGPDGQPSPSKFNEDPAPGPSNGSTVAHQPWMQPAGPTPPAPASLPPSMTMTSPHKPVKKESVSSPAKTGSGHKKERGSSGETHSGSQGQEKRRSSSGHHRSDKHSSRPATVPQIKAEPVAVAVSDPAPPPPSHSDSPTKQAVVATEQATAQEISPSKREEDRKHKDKKDEKHKKKKEKKEKKEKKDKKEKKEKKEGEEKKDDKDRKHKSKKKSKDKDKDKEKDRSKVADAALPGTPSQPKLTIKMATPTVSPGRAAEQEQGTSQPAAATPQPAIPKIKLKLGGSTVVIQGDKSESNSQSSSKKDRDKDSSRKRSSSSVKLDKLEGPAAKMARAIGTDPSKEARFLEESFKKTNDRKIVKPRLLPN